MMMPISSSILGRIRNIKNVPLAISLLIVGIVLLAYGELFRLYFSLDEWGVIGYAHVTSWAKALTPAPGGWFPVGSLMAIPFGTIIAPESAIAWSSTAVIFHTINAILLFLLIRKISRDNYLASATTILFAVSPVGSEMLRYLAMFGSVMGFTVMLGAMHAATSRRYILSLFLFGLGLLINSYSPTLAPVLLVLIAASGYMNDATKKTIRNAWTAALLTAVVLVVFLLYEKSLSVIPGGAPSLQSGTGMFVQRILIALFVSPAVVLPQLFWFFKGNFHLPTMVALSLGILGATIAWLIALVVRRKHDPAALKTVGLILLSFWWMYSAYLYFSVIRQPVLDAAVSSRYIYASSMGAALFAGIVLWQLSQLVARRQTMMAVSLILLMILSILSIQKTRFLVSEDVVTGKVRQRILKAVKNYQPTISKQAVIYMGSDFGAYTIHANLGYILSVLYADSNKAYRDIATNSRLFNDPPKEWYAQFGGDSLGYVQSYETLLLYVDQYKLSHEAVFAFSYDKDTDQTRDNTARIRELLASRTQPKKLITSRDQWLATTQRSDQEVDSMESAKILDGDRSTGVTVEQRKGNYVQLDLGRVESDVAQIDLVTADGNSFPRSYAVEGSVDGVNWQTLVENETAAAGIRTSIPFAAKDLRYIRVTNTVEKPMFFQWSLAEIDLYSLDR